MKNAVRLISRILKIGTLMSTLGLLLSVVIQIYARFFMDNAPSWTEEASRLFFIYAICFASGLAFKQHYFVALDLITSKLNKKWNSILGLFTNIMVLFLFGIISIYSISYIQLGFVEKSPSLGFNMSISFASILLMSLSICFFSIVMIFQQTKTFK